MKVYDIATAVRCFGPFRSLDTGDFKDPDTITMVLKSPSGIEVSYHFGSSAMVRDAVGQYHLDVGPWSQADVGDWSYRYVGTGAVRAGGKGSFRVADPGFTTPYGT